MTANNPHDPTTCQPDQPQVGSDPDMTTYPPAHDPAPTTLGEFEADMRDWRLQTLHATASRLDKLPVMPGRIDSPQTLAETLRQLARYDRRGLTLHDLAGLAEMETDATDEARLVLEASQS